MSYQSNISGRTVYNDHNARLLAIDPVVGGEQMSRGKLPRPVPEGRCAYAEPFNIPVIPRSEWPARIEEKDRTKTWIRDLCEQAGLGVLNQNGTSFCWINAPTHCMEIVRVVMGQPLVRLSPASVGCKIKNFRNQGGWGTEGLHYIAEHGTVPQSLWPPNAISRQYDTAAANGERPKYRCLEWWELRDRNFDQVATCVLLNIPVAVGYNWWAHEVTAVGLKVSGGRFLLEIANSWGANWEDRGYGLLSESKGTPDDAIAPRVATPSG
jgi:hypothetical protein